MVVGIVTMAPALFALQAVQETGLQLLLCCWLPSWASQGSHTRESVDYVQCDYWMGQAGELTSLQSFHHHIALHSIYSAELIYSVRNPAYYIPFFYFTCYSYSLLGREFYLVLIAKLEQKAATCSTGSGGGSRSVRFYCLDCYFCIISLSASPGVFCALPVEIPR